MANLHSRVVYVRRRGGLRSQTSRLNLETSESDEGSEAVWNQPLSRASLLSMASKL